MAITSLKAYAEFADFITSEPKLEDVANYHLSDESQASIRKLLDANRDGKLSKEQAEELDEYERLEYIIQTAKVRAQVKLAGENSSSENKKWVFIEAWAEIVSIEPYVLLLICKNNTLYEIIDPREGNKVVFTIDNYLEASYWLGEDEYTFIGRLYEGI